MVTVATSAKTTSSTTAMVGHVECEAERLLRGAVLFSASFVFGALIVLRIPG